jgi:amidohydrolase
VSLLAHTNLHDRLAAAGAAQAGKIVTLSRRIYEQPELSGEETKARAWCTALLAEHGYEIDAVPGVETAFVATLAGRLPGPTIGLLAEYDALPGVGHACGHHLIAGSAVGAGIALAACREELPGTIKVFGCPAEEIGLGKAAMLQAGAFAGTDAAFTFHANDITSVMVSSSAIHELLLEFHGAASHAATAPWDGASALDGVLLTYQNVNALRQFVRDGVRIHGIITNGGEAFNVVPERADCRVAVRSTDSRELARVVGRVTDCARAAALASATELKITTGMQVQSVAYHEQLADLVRRNLPPYQPVENWNLLGSTDFGNVSNVLPAVLFSIATWPSGTAFHTHEAAKHAGEAPAFEAMLAAAQTMATASVDLLLAPEILERETTVGSASQP